MRGTFDGREFWGMTLRLYDPQADEWSLYRADTWHPGIRTPLVGGFRDGLGEFFGADEEVGVPVQARFRWSGITAQGARWGQAFSVDDGATWETNWVMDFERISDAAGGPGAARPGHRFRRRDQRLLASFSRWLDSRPDRCFPAQARVDARHAE